MRIFPRRFMVSPNSRGFLFERNRLARELSPGIYYHFDPLDWRTLVSVPTIALWATVDNQEVLAKDNVSFRFSYSIAFSFADPRNFIERTYHTAQGFQEPWWQANQLVHLHSQVVIREKLAQLASNEINENRASILEGCEAAIQKELAETGLKVEKLLLKDVSFPKRIQDLFALELESRIRAKSDLENARTSVAAARALKNAAELLKGDPQVQFMQYLETISKISASGKHTFVIGEMSAQLPRNT